MLTMHPFILYFLAIVSFLVTFLAALFGGLNGTRAGNLFRFTVGNISDKYYAELTPASYVFGTIWPINFIWTCVGSFYLVVSIFLSKEKSPLKSSPPLTPIGFFVGNTIAFALTVSWYFVYESQSVGWTYAVLVIMVASTYLAIAATLKSVAENAEKLEKNYRVTIWLVRILVQNGLCCFATWITAASVLGLVMLLAYVDSPDQPIAIERGLISITAASTVGLALLLCLILIWFILENFVFEKYTRYIFTIYPVFIFAFSGVVYKLQFRPEASQNLIFGSVNLAVASVLFLIRIGLSVYRYQSRKNEIGTTANEKEKMDELEIA